MTSTCARDASVGHGEGATATATAASRTMCVLRCARCGHPITSDANICADRAVQAWRQHVYAYEHDLFSNDQHVWLYSATNPQQRRFDVVRIRPCVPATPPRRPHAPRDDDDDKQQDEAAKTTHKNDEATAELVVDVSDAYESEHTFFVGYDWSAASCVNCHSFLGWAFASHERVVAAQHASARARDTRSAPSSHERKDDGGDDDEATKTSAVDEMQDDGGNADGNDEGVLTPEFIGLIVTHCTGCDDYPERLFTHAMRSLARTRRRVQAVQVCVDALQSASLHAVNYFAVHALALAVIGLDKAVQCEWCRPYKPYKPAATRHNNSSDDDDDEESNDDDDDDEHEDSERHDANVDEDELYERRLMIVRYLSHYLASAIAEMEVLHDYLVPNNNRDDNSNDDNDSNSSSDGDRRASTSLQRRSAAALELNVVVTRLARVLRVRWPPTEPIPDAVVAMCVRRLLNAAVAV